MSNINLKTAAYAGLLALAGLGSQAQAALISDSWSNTRSWAGGGITIPPTVNYTHSLGGFNDFASTIYAWTLTLDLVDDGNGTCYDGECEAITIRVNGTDRQSYASTYSWLSWNFDLFTETASGVGSPLVGGLMNVSIRATTGDVKLRSSTLDAYGKTETTRVPEPGTLGLLGLGLLGAGLVRRRSAAKA